MSERDAASTSSRPLAPSLLVLIEEVTKRSRLRGLARFLAALRAEANIVVVAACYLKSNRRLRRLGSPSRTFAFPAETYDADIADFASELNRTYEPDWVLSVGNSNAQLVASFDALSVAVLSWIPVRPEGSSADGGLYRIFRHAAGIALATPFPPELVAASGSLEAREPRSIPVPLRAGGSGLWSKRRRMFWPFNGGRIDGHGEVAALIAYGNDLAARRRRATRQARIDRDIIAGSSLFDAQLAGHDADDPLDAYLRASAKGWPYSNMYAGRLVRRPMKGFNPLIYATDSPKFDGASGEDPCAQFLRAGRTPGRWTHGVLDAAAREAPAKDGEALPKAAVHLHLHYTDLLPDFLSRLRGNWLDGIDLHITTTSEEGAAEIESLLSAEGLPTSLRAFVQHRDNLGRDVWPFVDLLQTGTFRDYDIVGHFHGKRSVHFSHGDVWRRFLWDHLIGDGDRPVVDVIRTAFAANPFLGLVFPEEPHLEGWDRNLTIATDLARRMGLALPLPIHFEYPMGTMFWARPQALSPLLRLNLTEADIPREPVPNDGTILHAVECLMVFIVEAAGFTYRTTYVPGSCR